MRADEVLGAYEAYEVLLSMKSWSDTECEEIIITLAGWCCVLSSQFTLKSTWSGSRKVTLIYGSKVETFANDSITFGKIYHPISWQSYESTGWMVPCSLQPVYVKKCVKHEGENWEISNSCNLRRKWLDKLCGRAIWRQPIDMKYEVG